MFGSTILDVTIGLLFVFILVSIICTSVREGFEAWLKTRAAYLERGIKELLKDKVAAKPKDAGDTAPKQGLAELLYNHPFIYGLYNGEYKRSKDKAKPGTFDRGKNLPSYIPSKNFASALMDLAARGPEEADTNTTHESTLVSLDNIRQNIAKLNNSYVQRVLLHMVDTAQGDINKLQAKLEAWYDSSMDRVSGWYKRSTQLVILIIGIVMAVGLNINCFKIASYLVNNETARTVIVERASALSKDSTFSSGNYNQAKSELNSLDLPIGWEDNFCNSIKLDKKESGWWNDWAGPIVGWLVIAFASTLGAPFWFDLLNKIMVIRATVKPHEKSGEESSEDRQKPAPKTGQ